MVDMLEQLESRHVIHNDIKPDNMLFNRDGSMVLGA